MQPCKVPWLLERGKGSTHPPHTPHAHAPEGGAHAHLHPWHHHPHAHSLHRNRHSSHNGERPKVGSDRCAFIDSILSLNLTLLANFKVRTGGSLYTLCITILTAER